MPRDRYEPIKLNQTNRYAGYQFHARVRIDGMQSFEAFKYLILTVLEWVRKRLPAEDAGVPELTLPSPERYAEADTDLFRPYHFSVGYALDITPLMYEGIWAMRLKEPDSLDKEDTVAGRFFTTRVGLWLSDKGYTEMGIRIDVTDPASVEKEVDFAFRPAFVRSLAIQPSVSFEQVGELKRGIPEKVETEEDYKRFLRMLDSEDNQLPLVVFTHFRPGRKEEKKEEKKPALGMSMEDFVKSDPMKSLLSSGTQLPGMGIRHSGFDMDKAGFKMPEMPSSCLSKKPRAVLERIVTMEQTADVEPSAQTKDSAAAADPPVMPFDAAAFSSSSFAYARTYVLGDSFFEKLRGRLKKEFVPGVILLCGARKFRGGVAAVGSYSGSGEDEVRKAYDSALLAAQSYSKHKAPYDFGSVVFEAEARNMAQQREFRTIIEGQYEDKEKYDRLVQLYQEQSKAISEKNEKIDRLEKQCAEEFARGEAFRENEILDCEEEIARLRKDLADEEEKNRQMLDGYQWAKNVESGLNGMRKVEKLPACNADVVSYFLQVYPDRIGFTVRGEAEASSCGLKTDHLWEILYMAANDLTDLFRSVQGNLTEEDVTRVAGCEMSFKEGSMTRKDSDFMRLREDEYEGKTISVEPHLKLKSWKGEPAHQRLHFCYDQDLRKIIIGYLGDHLDSAASRYAGQR